MQSLHPSQSCLCVLYQVSRERMNKIRHTKMLFFTSPPLGLNFGPYDLALHSGSLSSSAACFFLTIISLAEAQRIYSWIPLPLLLPTTCQYLSLSSITLPLNREHSARPLATPREGHSFTGSSSIPYSAVLTFPHRGTSFSLHALPK